MQLSIITYFTSSSFSIGAISIDDIDKNDLASDSKATAPFTANQQLRMVKIKHICIDIQHLPCTKVI
jgi:hypothetical protein